MIKPISVSSLVFRANEPTSARDLYDNVKKTNAQIADSQKVVAQAPQFQPSMQGVGENLNVIA